MSVQILILILSLSIIFQAAAAGTAIAYLKRTGYRFAWGLIATAMVLMTFRRVITLWNVAAGHGAVTLNLEAEIVALIIAMLMFIGVLSIGRMLSQELGKGRNLEDERRRVEDFALAAGDWWWEMGPDLRFTYLSDNATEITGVPVPFHLGKTRADLAIEDIRSPHWQKHLDDLRHHRPFKDFRFLRQGHDGRIHYLSESGVPVFAENGTFQGYRGVATDISEENKAQRRLIMAIETISEGFVLFDENDKLVVCNQKYRNLYSTSAEAIVPGATSEEIVRFGVERGQYPEAAGRE